MPRTSNSDVHAAFDEYPDEENGSKCNRVKCKHCGFVRAKNTTRQIEHLQECSAFINSPEGRAAMYGHSGPNATRASPAEQLATPTQPRDVNGIYMGQRPNPNLRVHRRGPNKRNRDGTAKAVASDSPVTPRPARAASSPSLTTHLLSTDPSGLTTATQQTFLSHAGCGTLSPGALSQWLSQDAHISRGYISFAGALISKIRLPQTSEMQVHPLYRTMDLLISVLSNARREMSFFEITAAKYGLQLSNESPSPITRSYLDLFNSASSPGASLIEGMVVLWATEHCYRASWTYASTFSSSDSSPFLPPFSNASTESHIAALHQSLIPNWTSPAFDKFVDACRAVVDELANAQTSGNGREEMSRCASAWSQVVWLWERRWPGVDGMGQEKFAPGASNGQTKSSNAAGSVRIAGEDEDQDADEDEADDIV